MSDHPDTSDRFDRWLLDAGFDPSPDTLLAGRAADELAAASEAADDPWAGLAAAPSLSDDQREYLLAASPELSAALPEQALDGSTAFADVDDADLAAADDDIIDFESE